MSINIATQKIPRILVLTKYLRSKLSLSKVLTSHLADYTFIDDKIVTHEMIIPESLCIPKKADGNNKEESIMSTSCALALFDELNTSSFLFHDRLSRPGVSIVLNVEMLQSIRSGQRVSISFSSDKIGKTLGFSSMTMKSTEGTLLARGSHIKFLPRGWLVDTVLAPLLNRIIFFLDWLVKSKMSSLNVDDAFVKIFAGKNLGRRAKDVPTETLAAALDSLDVTEHVSSTQATDTHIQYSFPVQPHMWNIIGLLHGGAIGMCVEQALRLHLMTVGLDKAWYIQSIDARYLASTKVIFVFVFVFVQYLLLLVICCFIFVSYLFYDIVLFVNV